MRPLLSIIVLAALSFGQASEIKVATSKPSDFEPSIVKIVVLGLGPNGYTSIGTGFIVGDHSIASAAHVYLDAAKSIIDGGVGAGTIAALKVFRDGRKPVYFNVTFHAADFAHDVVLMDFNAEEVKKQQPSFPIKPLQIESNKPELGSEVLFMGYFAGDEQPILSHTTIAGFTAPEAAEQLILDIPANPGQSGSPVLDLRTGKVVGILASFVPVTLVPGSLPTHSGLSRSVEVVHLKRLIESADVR